MSKRYRKAPELSKNAQDYILENCNPLKMIMDTMNGELADEFTVSGKKVMKRPASLDQRLKAAMHLSDKIAPNLKSAEVNLNSKNETINHTGVDLSSSDLTVEERTELREMAKRRLSIAEAQRDD